MSIYAVIAALGIVTSVRVEVRRRTRPGMPRDTATAALPSSALGRPWQMLGGILQGILWTVLATDVFQAATGRQALPAWLVIGIAGRWMGHLSGIGAALNVRAAGSVQDAWVVRLLRRPAFFLPLWLLGFAVALATPIFWTVLFVLLVRR